MGSRIYNDLGKYRDADYKYKMDFILEEKGMLERIQELVADGLGVDAGKVQPQASFKEDLGADSLDLYELVMAFEEEFGVSIPAEELEKMATVKDVMDYIEANK